MKITPVARGAATCAFMVRSSRRSGDITRHGFSWSWLSLLAVAACSGALSTEQSGDERGPDADVRDAGVDDRSVDSTGSGTGSDAGSVGADGGRLLNCPSPPSSDASAPQCTPDVWPLVLKRHPSGNCTVTLPTEVDSTRLSIEATFVFGTQARSLLPKVDAPCPESPGWYLVDQSTIEICALCSTNFEADVWAVVGCTDDSLDGSASDACVPEIVNVPMHLNEAGCFMDLLPDADWCVPIGFTYYIGFGHIPMDAGFVYDPSLSCDDPSNGGWQPVSDTTLRLCAGSCIQPPLYEGSQLRVTLKCGGT